MGVELGVSIKVELVSCKLEDNWGGQLGYKDFFCTVWSLVSFV